MHLACLNSLLCSNFKATFYVVHFSVALFITIIYFSVGGHRIDVVKYTKKENITEESKHEKVCSIHYF